MSIPNTVHTFMATLLMMGYRNYSIEPYRELMDAYDSVRDQQKMGETVSDDLMAVLTAPMVLSVIRGINGGNYGFVGKGGQSRPNFVFIVTNYTTGENCLVVIDETGNFGADDLAAVLSEMEELSQLLTNDKDYCRPQSGIRGTIVLRDRICPIPRSRIEHITNMEVIEQKVVLARPFDNIMQSQHTFLSSEETRSLFEETRTPQRYWPTMTQQTDSFYKYARQGNCIDKTTRTKITPEEMLDRYLYYRYVRGGPVSK
jgi:hypothetical protein